MSAWENFLDEMVAAESVSEFVEVTGNIVVHHAVKANGAVVMSISESTS